MNLTDLLGPTVQLSGPPPGSVNVRIGQGVEGPGGRWVPCATEIGTGTFYSGLFQVGPGKRQVCANFPFPCPDRALSYATELATSAAA